MYANVLYSILAHAYPRAIEELFGTDDPRSVLNGLSENGTLRRPQDAQFEPWRDTVSVLHDQLIIFFELLLMLRLLFQYFDSVG